MPQRWSVLAIDTRLDGRRLGMGSWASLSGGACLAGGGLPLGGFMSQRKVSRSKLPRGASLAGAALVTTDGDVDGMAAVGFDVYAVAVA